MTNFLIVTNYDIGGVWHNMARGIRMSDDHDARMFLVEKHEFNYPSDDKENIFWMCSEDVEWADVVVMVDFGFSHGEIYNEYLSREDLSGKRVILSWWGTNAYNLRHHINRLLEENPEVNCVYFDSKLELTRGKKIWPAVDVGKRRSIPWIRKCEERLVISHSFISPLKKNTKYLVEQISRDYFDESTIPVVSMICNLPHEHALDLISQSHLYYDGPNSELSLSAIEAGMMGVPVITDSNKPLHEEVKSLMEEDKLDTASGFIRDYLKIYSPEKAAGYFLKIVERCFEVRT